MRNIFLLMVGCLVFTSCSGCNTYSHRVLNIGTSQLFGLTIESHGQRFGHGTLPPNCEAAYTGSMRILTQPPPFVSWRTNLHGAVISVAVPLESNQRANEELVIEVDGVRGVVSVTRDRRVSDPAKGTHLK
jgi:hypothetical protein